MLERLFKNKKFLFIYFLNIFGAFSNFAIGCPSASCALFASEVENKIPALIPVLFTAIVQGVVFGKVAVIRYIAFVLLYAITKVKLKSKKELNENDFGYLKDYLSRVLIISCVIEVLLLITKITIITDIPYIIAHVLLTTGFSFLFERGFKYISSISNDKEKITVINTISFVFMAVCITSCLNLFKIINVNIWMLMAVVVLMIYSWKNYISRSLLCALIVFLATVIFAGFNPLSLLLFAVCSIVTALLSKANKKGAVIGIAISVLYIVISLFNYSAINDLTANNEIQQDYMKYIQKEAQNSDDEAIKSVSQFEEMAKESQNSSSKTILKSMLVGFIMLLAIPEKYLEKLKVKMDKKDGFTLFKEKVYSKFVLGLNPGTAEEINTAEEKAVKSKGKTKKKKV